MHELRIIQDLAVIMIIAGFTTVLFHRLKQPVVLGYIIAGVIIGPYTPPFALIQDPSTIRLFAELGVIFLMFSLGLDFTLRHLRRVGISAIVASIMEIVVMLWIGYEIGRLFGWNAIDAIFLGAILAISSTTIIVKVLNDLKLQRKAFVQLVFGILIVEDILGIAILALLSGLGTNNSINFFGVLQTLGELLLFLGVSLSMGLLIVPRLLSYVDKFNKPEMLLVTVLGLCFSFCLLVIKLNYSVVLGAFLIGAIIAESRQVALIQQLIAPLRDMFSAIFFVAVGMLLDPKLLIPYAGSIAVITLAVVLGKIISCSFGAFITGQNGHTSLRVGTSLAQIGEFSFIIAALGVSLKVTSDFLYPIAVTVSAITTILTPYLIKSADPVASYISKIVPDRVKYLFEFYTKWLASIKPTSDPSEINRMVRRNLMMVLINLAFVAGIFLSISYASHHGLFPLTKFMHVRLFKTIAWGFAVLLSVPFLIAIYRRLKALGIILAKYSVREKVAGRFTQGARRIIAEVIPLISMLAVILFIFALSASLLPPGELVIVVLVIVGLLVLFLWRWFVQLYSRLQDSLVEAIEKKDET